MGVRNFQIVKDNTSLPGGNSEWEPPDPFSNSEVKTLSADGSVGSPHVRVGHRQALFRRSRSPRVATFFCMGRAPLFFVALGHPWPSRHLHIRVRHVGPFASLRDRPLACTLAAFARAKAVLSLHPRSPSCESRTSPGFYSKNAVPERERLFYTIAWRCPTPIIVIIHSRVSDRWH